MGVVSTITDLEGTWLAVEARVDGEPAQQIVGQRLCFTGDRFQISKNGELLYGGGVTLDALDQRATIDFDQHETDTLAGTWLGIYERDGDVLVICDNAANMACPRPSGFDKRNDRGYVWVRFERQH